MKALRFVSIPTETESPRQNSFVWDRERLGHWKHIVGFTYGVSQNCLTNLFHVTNRCRWSKYCFLRNSSLHFLILFSVPLLLLIESNQCGLGTPETKCKVFCGYSSAKKTLRDWTPWDQVNNTDATKLPHRICRKTSYSQLNFFMSNKSFDETCSVESMKMSGRPLTSVEHEGKVSDYCNRYRTRSVRRAETDLEVWRSVSQLTLRENRFYVPK